MSHKIHNFKPKGPKDKRTFAQRLRQNPAVNRNKVTTRRSKSYKSFYFSQEAKGIKIHRKLMTSILKTFHHFNRSSADNKHRTRSYDLWRLTGNWSYALVTSACCYEIFVVVVSNFHTVFTFFDKKSSHRSRNSHAYLFFFYLPTRL